MLCSPSSPLILLRNVSPNKLSLSMPRVTITIGPLGNVWGSFAKGERHSYKEPAGVIYGFLRRFLP